MDAFDNLPEPQPLLAVVNGGCPPPPPAPPGGSRVPAIQDRRYGPALAIRDRPSPYQSKDAEPLALKDKPKPVIKKPKIFDPPRRPPLIIDPPPRVKPRKNKEILQILDDLEDDAQPKRPKKAPPPPTQLAIRNKLRVVPA